MVGMNPLLFAGKQSEAHGYRRVKFDFEVEKIEIQATPAPFIA